MSFWTIIIALAMGFFCYTLAKDKNRDTTIAFICGVLFGVFALIYYLIVGKKENM